MSLGVIMASWPRQDSVIWEHSGATLPLMLQWTKGWGEHGKNEARWAGEVGEVGVLEMGSEGNVKSITRGWCAGAEVRQGSPGLKLRKAGCVQAGPGDFGKKYT